MIKRVTLLLATLLAVGHFSNPVFAQDDESGDQATATTTTTTTDTAPADTTPADGKEKKKGKGGDAEPECD
jgi:uncharacterized protein YggE